MTKLSYSTIVTIVALLLVAIAVFLFFRWTSAKNALNDAENNSKILLTQNTVYMDRFAKEHTVATQAKIGVKWLKASNEKLNTSIYNQYLTINNKKKTSAIIGAAINTHNTVTVVVKAKDTDTSGLIVRQFQTPYIDALVVIGSDTSTLEYSTSDTAIVGITDYKIGKWKLINLFHWRTIGHKADVFLTNPNSKIVDVKYYDIAK
jgi:hypothetical protein